MQSSSLTAYWLRRGRRNARPGQRKRQFDMKSVGCHKIAPLTLRLVFLARSVRNAAAISEGFLGRTLERPNPPQVLVVPQPKKTSLSAVFP